MNMPFVVSANAAKSPPKFKKQTNVESSPISSSLLLHEIIAKCFASNLRCDNSPHLEAPIIKGLLHCDTNEWDVCECLLGYYFLLSCFMKVIKITGYKGTTGDLEQLKHFLGELLCLELLKVKIFELGEKGELEITKDMLMHTRASSKCKTKVNNSCID